MAAGWGTAMHAWKETGRPVSMLEKKLLMSGVDRDEWWPTSGGGRHEVTFAIKLATSELRLYSAYVNQMDGCGCLNADDWKKTFDPREWLTGTIDWLDGTWVDDLKTGTWPVLATESGQLRSYALVPWLMRGKPKAYWAPISITQWTRYPLAGQPERNWDWVSGAELAIHLDELLWATENPDVAVASDEGCKFCECKPHCAAYQERN